MAIKIIGQHAYGTDGNVWEVSAEAAAEKRANWHEIPDVADGYAYVDHSDWHALFEYYKTNHAQDRTCAGSGCAFLINAHGPDGKIAHIGSISMSYAELGKVYLAG